ncbi:MAG: hypothetical protein J6K76_03855 [Spirochaetaceae bacterium]|nr:hypothetical protein [Spirochaetaceae bacterium]
MHQNKDTFNFTYSAAHREEVEHIRSKYMESQESDLDELRKIDARVTSTATFAAIGVGIVGIMVFGCGLSLCLSLGRPILGIVLSGAGLVVMGCGLLVNRLVLQRLREKYAPRVMELSDKLLRINKSETI